jgi:hypothetical protein
LGVPFFTNLITYIYIDIIHPPPLLITAAEYHHFGGGGGGGKRSVSSISSVNPFILSGSVCFSSAAVIREP